MNKSKRFLGGALAMTVALAVVMSGCGKKNEPATVDSAVEMKPVKLTWYLRAAEPKNATEVVAKLNELTDKKLKITVDYKFINPGDYDQKMQVIQAASEEYDLCYTAAWLSASKYEQGVSKGAYVALDDILNKFPKLKTLLPQKIWDGVKVNGKIYGVPNYQLMYDLPGLWMKKDLVDKYKIDTKAIKTWDDLTAALMKVKAGEPNIIPAAQCNAAWFTKDYHPSLPGGFGLDPKTWKVYDSTNEGPTGNFETFKKVARDWQQKGLFAPDAATTKDWNPQIKAGKVFMNYSVVKPGGEVSFKATNGYDQVLIPMAPLTMSKNSITATVTAVSATSKNPERAMALVEMYNTDKELYDTLSYGIEGKDYKRVSPTRVEPITGGWTFGAWMVGNQFNASLLPGQPDDVWEVTKKNNEAAILDPAFDLFIDRTPIQTEIAQLDAIYKEFGPIINYGLDDPDKVTKNWLEKRKAAGSEKVRAELQKQVDTWRATKK